MRRREFIAAIGITAALSGISPKVRGAQSPERVQRIGILVGGIENTTEALQALLGPFRDGLSMLGWTEGRNLRIDLRVSGDDAGRIRADAAELVSLAPELTVAISAVAARALQQQTRTTPIVIIGADDIFAPGLVKNMARPDGNITGVSDAYESVNNIKWLQLLKEVAPEVERVGVNSLPPSLVTASYIPAMEEAARAFGVKKLITMAYRDPVEIERAIDAFAAEPNGGLWVNPATVANRANRETINRQAIKHRLPTIYTTTTYAAEGGLMYYGSDLSDLFRRAPFYVDRILRGAKVNELPVELFLNTRFKLVVNLKTAKAIGLAIPESFLVRADEVIQ